MKSIKIPRLESERLLLNKIEAQDHRNIFKGLSHPEVIRYYGVQYSSYESTKEQMNWYSNLEKSNSGMWWAIRLKESGDFCGAIGINDYQKEHNKAEIGFWLLPDFWRKGFINESANTIINYLFKELKLHRLEAYVEVGNENSSNALKKLGFDFEGRMIDCEVKNGNYISVEIYSKLNKIE